MSFLEWLAAGLVIGAILLFIAELFVPSNGLLATAAALLLVAAGIAFASGHLSAPNGRDWFIIVMSVTLLLLVIVALGNAFRLRHMAPLTGPGALIGLQGQARSDLDPRGFVFVSGEYWSAESAEGSVHEGDAVIITAVNGLNLTVRRANGKEPRDE
jgi:membrane-bound serine protease (ClpP class)